jgi:hypothetical protein
MIRCTLFCVTLCACMLRTEYMFAQQEIDVRSVISGKVALVGKSQRQIGTLCRGTIDSIKKDRSRNHFEIVCDKSTESDEQIHFGYSSDQKFDQFFSAVPSDSPAFSSDKLAGKTIYFFESITCGGDPREFVTRDDVVCGPFFRIRSHLQYTLQACDVEPTKEVREFVSVESLESGAAYIRGNLNARIGTVLVCRCEIKKSADNEVIISSTTIPATKFRPDDVAIFKNGSELSWAQVVESDLHSVMCYERIECAGRPIALNQSLQDATRQDDFSIRCILVVKLPSDS